MNESKSIGSKEEWSMVEHALAYLNKADKTPSPSEVRVNLSGLVRVPFR